MTTALIVIAFVVSLLWGLPLLAASAVLAKHGWHGTDPGPVAPLLIELVRVVASRRAHSDPEDDEPTST